MAMILTDKQSAAQKVLASPSRHCMLYGGARSGKTFLLTRNVVMRALKAPKSRHSILRFRFNHCKQSIVQDTFPKVMALAFPGVKYELNRTDWYAEFEGDQQIWFGGLDDKERTEKILGQEYSTMYLNEASQIPSQSRDMAVTRLAQKVDQVMSDGKGGEIRRPLPMKMYYDANPTSKAHWTYLRFVKKVDPETKLPLANPDDYAHFQLNPMDNLVNLSEGYMETLEGLPARMKRRFLLGEFSEAAPNALWTDEMLDRWRVIDGDKLPDMQRIVIGVDPSGAGSSSGDGDEIGIVVCGLGTDGNAYVLEDLTLLAGPAVWGRVVASAYDRWGADAVIGETNYGGAMVKHVIQTARPRTPYRAVTATRGKSVRAEPISALFELGKARMVGYHRKMEDELCAFSTSGYLGENSPNHADACLSGDSLVRTSRGNVPIRDVCIGDQVLTRSGYRNVLDSRMTRESANTMKVVFSDGRVLYATEDHPVFVVGKGFVRTDSLVCGDMMESLEKTEVLPCATVIQKLLSLIRSRTFVTRIVSTGRRAFISSAETICTIASYLKNTMGQFLMGGTFITPTGIRSITMSQICGQFHQKNTEKSIALLRHQKDRGIISTRSAIWPQLGTKAKQDESGTEITPWKFGKAWRKSRTGCVSLAERSFSAGIREGKPAFALTPATAGRKTPFELMKEKSIALFAERSSGRTNTEPSQKPAPVRVVQVCEGSVEPVFNLEVEHDHEFFANGVLVHNCVWAMSDLFPGMVKPEKKKESGFRRFLPEIGSCGWMA